MVPGYPVQYPCTRIHVPGYPGTPAGGTRARALRYPGYPVSTPGTTSTSIDEEQCDRTPSYYLTNKRTGARGRK
eukprot:1894452-Rhodomonas_salina.1